MISIHQFIYQLYQSVSSLQSLCDRWVVTPHILFMRLALPLRFRFERWHVQIGARLGTNRLSLGLNTDACVRDAYETSESGA